ncbi:MAG TPA: DUF488 family protein [Paraburkholderia sp.]|jgi:uncharacterized protein YeaO (DUF488 family)|nr:DUF488 family protein [Paraburkholderia sp.]
MNTKPKIDIQRVYGASADADARDACFLVDRLWPRGIRKESLAHCTWLKDVAPSNALRTWFHQDPTQWDAFRHRYEAELDANPAAWQPLADAAAHRHVVLLYGSRNEEQNHAIVLRDFLLHRLKHG